MLEIQDDSSQKSISPSADDGIYFRRLAVSDVFPTR